ncbi:MAG: bifunctional metallophosphatase/5'-nucleotidase [Erysipelotrichia bacterium]|nr:bifunctional metallophosphatase/5'-nucleotidase [Erysipelotrichia bacterium]
MKQAVLWHTNDVHSSFDQFLGISSLLKRYRNPDSDLCLDAGDFCDYSSAMINGTDGTGGIHLLKSAGYDAMAVGNNEFFAHISALRKMACQGFPMLSCNLTDLNGFSIEGLESFVLIKRNGIRYLVIGVSPYWGDADEDTAFTDMAGIRLISPYEAIRDILNQQKGRYDVSILLSHAGWHTDDERNSDRRIAMTVEGLDIILGGHSHVLMDSAERVGRTWIHQSGSHAEYLGKVTLRFDQNNRLADVQAENISNSASPDSDLMKVLNMETKRGTERLKRPLYQLDHTLHFDAEQECAAVNAVADALHLEYGGNLSLINNGILSGDIDRKVSQMSLLEAEPSPLNPTVLQWYGRQIIDAIQASFQIDVIRKCDHRWNGFRGNILGPLAVSWNTTVHRSPFSITIDGNPVDPNALYTVVTDDFLQRGSGYEMLGVSKGIVKFHDEYIRDLLKRTLNNPDLIIRAEQKRILE